MLTKHIAPAVAVSLALSASATASAQGLLAAPYFRVEAGYSWARDAKLRDNNFPANGQICGNAPCTMGGELNDIGSSAVLGAAVGARLHPNVRAELAVGYRGSYKLDDVDAGVPISYFTADAKSLSVMLNGYYDFGSGPLRPYVTAGIGYARNKLGTVELNLPATAVRLPIGGATKGNLAWSAGLGVGYAMTNRLTLDVGYRYIDLGDIEASSQTLPFNFGPYSGATGKLRAHEITVGLRF